ncbi:hypothetical protein BH11CYA1_BH11CYA1_04740 [soil metagenome]
MATALLGLVGLSQADAIPPNSSGPGWTAVGQLLQTFDGAELSKASKVSKNSKISKVSKGTAKASAGPSSLIDYREMSLRCLGKKDWESLTVSQRNQFVASLKGLVEQRYYPRWHKIFGKGKVTFQEEVSQGGDIIVRTKLMLGKKEELLSWRVAGSSGTEKIVSLSVSNSDLLERLKSRIQARKQKVGFEALLAWMKGRSSDDLNISSGSTGNSGVGRNIASGVGVNSTNGMSANAGTVLPIAAVRAPSLTAAAASAAAASLSD